MARTSFVKLVGALAVFAANAICWGQADVPFSKRGTPEEREAKLAQAIESTVDYSFNYTSGSIEVASLASDLLEDRPVEIDKIEMGKIVPSAARAVARRHPGSFFYFQVPTAEKDTPFSAVSALLGKEDRKEESSINIGGSEWPITWHFFGWCGFGVAKDGKVYGLYVNCNDVPLPPGAVIEGPTPRTWTDLTGRTVEAQFVAFADGQVEFKRTNDGKTFRVPLETLSDRDKRYVERQTTSPAAP